MDNNQQTTEQTPLPEDAKTAPAAGANGRVARPMPNFGEMFKNMKMQTLLISLGVITAVLILFQVYFGLMSFAIDNSGLRISIIVIALLWSVPLLVKFFTAKESEPKKIAAFNSVFWAWKIPAGIAAVVLVITIGLAIFTTPLFLAKDFDKMIDPVQNSTVESDPGNKYGAFEADLPDFYTEEGTEDEMLVAIIDKAFAAQIGIKALGEPEGGLASQFTIRDYTLIHYNDGLYWVGAVEPKGFFQWTSTSKEGSPGYVLVDATSTDQNATAELVTSHPLMYTPGAYLWQDAERQMYFSKANSLRSSQINLELDEDGVPYYTQSVYKKQFGITSGDEVVGLITLNATTGETAYYTEDKAPAWIDRVQDPSITIKQLDYSGAYSYGFWNTVFAKKEVNVTSAGSNYVYYNKSLHLTTGFTSKSINDDAIIGTVMVNMRNNEANIYNMIGATERAAMSSAEGIPAVAAAGYYATFPATVNFNGVPTYYMGLKDSTGTIQMYAFVSVEKYTTDKAAAVSSSDAIAAYNLVVGGDEKPVAPESDGVEDTFEITDIKQYSVGGNTMFAIKHLDGIYYANINIEKGTDLLFAADGQTVKAIVVGDKIVKVISVT